MYLKSLQVGNGAIGASMVDLNRANSLEKMEIFTQLDCNLIVERAFMFALVIDSEF